MKRFNTTGTCNPEVHYMVNIDRQVEAAAKLVRQGDYFCINRGRQYGKTTTLAALTEKLSADFCVFNISFEGTDDSSFASASTVCAEFLKILKLWSRVNGSSEEMKALLKTAVPVGCKEINTTDFTEIIGELCDLSSKPVVVMIDEVDQASNNDGFIKFLGVLRKMFLSRNMLPTFQSVILAGVYDVKNLKLKMRSEDEHQYNSPWNIAVPFKVDMFLPANGIAAMLEEYKKDHQLDFDCQQIGQMIFDYTSGYPFLVSRICQIVDEEAYSWDKEGVLKATHDLLIERNTLFDDMIKKLDQYQELKDLLKSILFEGKTRTFYIDEKYLQIGLMFNFLKNNNGSVAIACRLMETRLYNMFIGEEETTAIFSQGQIDKSQFIHDGRIDMRRLIERFSIHFNEIYRPGNDDKFVEDNGRKIFLTYLRPIINGVGNYYCEAQTRDLTRTDIIIDYLGQQYIIELKIWHGQSYNERGEQQLTEYLDYYHLQTGYMVSFCFNKGKQPGVKEVLVGDKKLIEAIV